jgi:hypothetical protein
VPRWHGIASALLRRCFTLLRWPAGLHLLAALLQLADADLLDDVVGARVNDGRDASLR